jgi:hypothetical protein
MCSKDVLFLQVAYDVFALSGRGEWLGRQASNLGMPVAKAGALPLGDAPPGAVTSRGQSASLSKCGCSSKASMRRQSVAVGFVSLLSAAHFWNQCSAQKLEQRPIGNH